MSLFESGSSKRRRIQRAKERAEREESARLKKIEAEQRRNTLILEEEGEGFSEVADVTMVVDDDEEDDLKRLGQTGKRGTGLFI